MRHKFEIEEEIERVEPYTHVTDDYASAWEYVEARKNRSYQTTLRQFLECKSKEEYIKERDRIQNIIDLNLMAVKGFYKGSREFFTDHYQVDNCEDDMTGAQRGLNFVFSDSTLIKDLGNDNSRILKQIDQLKDKYENNCNKIREVQEWLKNN